jgi:hypothetical protein
MPNGRSASFNVSRHDFEQFLNTIPTGTLVGHLFSGVRGDRSFRALDALEARQLFAEQPRDRVFVEEQHQKFYIIHLAKREGATTWIVVRDDSPLFAEVRRHHSMWAARRQEQ